MTGIALHYECRGSGPPLVLLHGYTGSSRTMAGLAAALAQDCRTILPDLPGHGRSVVPGGDAAYSFAGCVDSLAETLVSAGHERAHWLGYSMGARLALACAVMSPANVESLVLIGGRAGIAEEGEREARRRADEALARRIESDGVPAFVDEWMSMPMFQTQRRLGAAFMDEQRRGRLANDAHGLAASLRAFGPAVQPPLFDDLPRIKVPVLLIAGALDPAFVAHAHDLAQRLPHAQVCEIADAGHAAHLEQPAAVAAAIREFMRGASDRARTTQMSSFQES